MLAAVLLVARVKLDVTIPRPLVFEHAQAIVASERHLVAVSLCQSFGTRKRSLSRARWWTNNSSCFKRTLAYLFVLLEERESRERALTVAAAERHRERRVGGRRRARVTRARRCYNVSVGGRHPVAMARLGTCRIKNTHYVIIPLVSSRLVGSHDFLTCGGATEQGKRERRLTKGQQGLDSERERATFGFRFPTTANYDECE